MEYAFWKHRTSGDIYAVAFYADPRGTQKIVAVSEPLRRVDTLRQPDPSEYETTDDDADWFNLHADGFTLYEQG